MLNKFIGIGYIGKNGVELRYTNSGKACSKFSLGMKRQFKNDQGNYEWDNIQVVVWGPQAEACANYLQAGSMAAIDGRIQVRSYDQDGQKRWVTEVVAESVRFLTPKNGQQNEGPIINEDDLPF